MNQKSLSLRRVLPSAIAILIILFGVFYFFHPRSTDTQRSVTILKPQASASSKPIMSPSYGRAMTTWLMTQYGGQNVSHIRSLYTKWLPPAYLSQVSFDMKGIPYLAATFVIHHGTQWTFDPIQADLPADQTKPLQVVTASGSLPNEKNGYVFVSGRVRPSVQYVVMHESSNH